MQAGDISPVLPISSGVVLVMVEKRIPSEMKDFAKNFSGTPRGLREALKKSDGKTFVFKGHHFWIV